MASSNSGMLIIGDVHFPTDFEERDVLTSALTKFNNQLFLDSEIFQALNSQEALQSQIQGFPGNMLGAVTLEMFEQPLEALEGILGCCPMKKLPDFRKDCSLGLDKKVSAATSDSNSRHILDAIKQMLVDQQDSIARLVKKHLKDLSIAHATHENRDGAHTTIEASPKQERSKSCISIRGIHQGCRPTRLAINHSSSQSKRILTVRDSVRHRPTSNYKPRPKKELRTGANAVPLGLKSSYNLKSDFEAPIQDFDALVKIIHSPEIRSLRVQDCAGFYRQMSTHKYCSGLLQEMIDIATPADIEKICDEVVPFIDEMVFHPFGNYVVQKLIVQGDEGIKRGLFNVFKNNMMCLTEDVCGCRVAQAAIQHFDENDAIILARELNGSLTECIRSRNGNHVIQACFTHLPVSKLGFLLDFVAAEVKHLGVHPFGCRVLQKILRKCDDSAEMAKVVEAVIDHCEWLAVDPYGNYIVQNALEYGTIAIRSEIVNAVAANISILSCDKFASNVVEKCLAKGSTRDIDTLIQRALNVEQGLKGIGAMAKDRFGNYVVQTMIGMADKTQREEIISQVESAEKLRNNPFGRAIANLLDKKE